jgi:hypothetical protein
VKWFVRRFRVREPKVSCRFETPPGQESPVNYGEGAPTGDPRTSKYRKPRLFVMTLGMNRHAFRKGLETALTMLAQDRRKSELNQPHISGRNEIAGLPIFLSRRSLLWHHRFAK